MQLVVRPSSPHLVIRPLGAEIFPHLLFAIRRTKAVLGEEGALEVLDEVNHRLVAKGDGDLLLVVGGVDVKLAGRLVADRG